jgi:sterol desaturase/sphingolipid hydroxylase (fatty acid hydroxylase superfamily)
MDDKVEVQDSARAARNGKGVWWVALGILTALALLSWALESSILLPRAVVGRYESLGVSLDAWAATHLPDPALRVMRTFAGLLASPLLYLGFAAVLVAEQLAPADRAQRAFSRGMVQDGLAWFLLDAPLKAFVYTGGLGVLFWLLDNYAPFLRIDPVTTGRFPTWSLVLAAIVTSDLLRWIHHYVNHKVRFLWHFHSVHHSQRELNLFTQARFHAVEAMSLVPILYAPLYALNLNFELAVWIVLLTEWHARVTHANLRANWGPLKHVLVTPQSHRIHHSRELCHRDQNFGILFSFWDRLFGTQWRHHDEYPDTGIADEDFPWEESVGGANVLSNYIAQLIYPFQQLLRSRRSATSQSEAQLKKS